MYCLSFQKRIFIALLLQLVLICIQELLSQNQMSFNNCWICFINGLMVRISFTLVFSNLVSVLFVFHFGEKIINILFSRQSFLHSSLLTQICLNKNCLTRTIAAFCLLMHLKNRRQYKLESIIAKIIKRIVKKLNVFRIIFPYNKMQLRMTKSKDKQKKLQKMDKNKLSDQSKKKKVSPKNKKSTDKSKDKDKKQVIKQASKEGKGKKHQTKIERQNKFFEDPLFKHQMQNEEQSKKCGQSQKIPYTPTPNVIRQSPIASIGVVKDLVLAKLKQLIINLKSLMIMPESQIIEAINYAKKIQPAVSDYFNMDYTNRMSYISYLLKQSGRKYQKYQIMAQEQTSRVISLYKSEWKQNKFIYEIQIFIYNYFYEVLKVMCCAVH